MGVEVRTYENAAELLRESRLSVVFVGAHFHTHDLR